MKPIKYYHIKNETFQAILITNSGAQNGSITLIVTLAILEDI